MPTLSKALAAHPIRKKPYNAIKFIRYDGNGTPLYRVAKLSGECGAAEALRIALREYGGHCFYCDDWMEPQDLSHQCTRDHLHPRRNGGGGHLHNLVFACGPCNRRKGHSELPGFHSEKSAQYLAALNDHLVRCLKVDAKRRGPSSTATRR